MWYQEKKNIINYVISSIVTYLQHTSKDQYINLKYINEMICIISWDTKIRIKRLFHCGVKLFITLLEFYVKYFRTKKYSINGILSLHVFTYDESQTTRDDLLLLILSFKAWWIYSALRSTVELRKMYCFHTFFCFLFNVNVPGKMLFTRIYWKI